jgi:hypothetical protein
VRVCVGPAEFVAAHGEILGQGPAAGPAVEADTDELPMAPPYEPLEDDAPLPPPAAPLPSPSEPSVVSVQSPDAFSDPDASGGSASNRTVSATASGASSSASWMALGAAAAAAALLAV